MTDAQTKDEIDRLNAETELLRARHAHERAQRQLDSDSEPWFMTRWWTPWALTFGAMAITATLIKALT
jgi:hypothetical protein